VDIIIGREGLARRPRAAIVALGLLSAFGPISLDLYLPSLPRITHDLATTAGATQLTLSGSLAGLAVGQLLIGPLSDRIGRRRPLLAGLTGFAVLSVLCAFAPSIGVLVVARIAQGLCGAAGLVLARAIVRDAYPDARIADVFSMLMLVNGLAPVIAPLVGGALLHVLPWRGLFAILAAVGVALGGLSVAALPETLPPERRHQGGLSTLLRAAREMSREPLFRSATTVVVLASAGLFSYISLSSLVLQSRFHLSASEFSLVFALNSVAIVLGGRVSWLLLRRMPASPVLGIGLITMAAGSVSGLIGSMLDLGLPALLASLFVAIGSIGLVLPNATALALLRHGRNAGTASALLGALQYAVGALAGPVASVHGATVVAMTAGMAVATTIALAVWVLALRAHAAGSARPSVVDELAGERFDRAVCIDA
jgi:MFS transporter, DHA1 family, multidrug resistance protein